MGVAQSPNSIHERKYKDEIPRLKLWHSINHLIPSNNPNLHYFSLIMHPFVFPFILSTITVVALAQTTTIEEDISFFGCAPLGAYYPPPNIDLSSKPIQRLVSDFTKKFDDLIQNGGSDKYGPVNVNTTSFSVVIFGGDEKLRDDPIVFEYYYTSPEDQISNKNVTLTTKFPVGDVTMVFTVYAWLAKMGEQWETPITKYLPELADVESPDAPSWTDITIGALAGQVSGLSRECKLVHIQDH